MCYVSYKQTECVSLFKKRRNVVKALKTAGMWLASNIRPEYVLQKEPEYCQALKRPKCVKLSSGQNVPGSQVAGMCQAIKWPECVRASSGQNVSGSQAAKMC